MSCDSAYLMYSSFLCWLVLLTLWCMVKDRWSTQWYTDNHKDLENRICQALRDMVDKEQDDTAIYRIGQ